MSTLAEIRGAIGDFSFGTGPYTATGPNPSMVAKFSTSSSPEDVIDLAAVRLDQIVAVTNDITPMFIQTAVNNAWDDIEAINSQAQLALVAETQDAELSSSIQVAPESVRKLPIKDRIMAHVAKPELLPIAMRALVAQPTPA